MRLALFDLDNTLLACDSDYEWGQFLVDRVVLDRDAYEAQNAAYYDQYVAGTPDIHEYLGFPLPPLAHHPPHDPPHRSDLAGAGAQARGGGSRCAPWRGGSREWVAGDFIKIRPFK